MEGVDGFSGLVPDLVGEAEGAGDLAVDQHVQHDLPAIGPWPGVRQSIEPVLGEEVRSADSDPASVHGGGDAAILEIRRRPLILHPGITDAGHRPDLQGVVVRIVGEIRKRQRFRPLNCLHRRTGGDSAHQRQLRGADVG